MRGRLGRRGLVVLAVVGVALLCAVPAGAKVTSVAGNGVVKVGQVPCGAALAPCAHRRGCGCRSPAKRFRAKVAVPRRVAAHAVATVRVQLGAQALKKLAGATAEVTGADRRRAAGTKKVSVAQAKISRPREPGKRAPVGEHPAHPEPALPSLDPDRRRTAALGAARDRGHRQQRDALLDAARLLGPLRLLRHRARTTGSSRAAVRPASRRPPRPARTGRAESSASLNYTINFAAKESWYDPLSGVAGIYGSGNVAFRCTGHTINLTAAEPEIEINGSASRAIFRFNGSGGTPYPNQRVALETPRNGGPPDASPTAVRP